MFFRISLASLCLCPLFFTGWTFVKKSGGGGEMLCRDKKKLSTFGKKRGEFFIVFVQKIKCFVQISGESRRTLTEMFYELKTIISRLCVNRR